MRTDVDGTTAEVTRQHLLALLNAVWEYKQDEKRAKGKYDILFGTAEKPGIIRDYAEKNPDDQLRDGETGVYLDRTTVSTGERLDIMGLAEKHPEVVARLAALGLLKMDTTAWKNHSKDFAEADIAKGFIMPGGETLRLEVKKEKD